MISVLVRVQGNKARAARILGVTRRSLYRLIEKYGLQQTQPTGTAESIDSTG